MGYLLRHHLGKLVGITKTSAGTWHRQSQKGPELGTMTTDSLSTIAQMERNSIV